MFFTHFVIGTFTYTWDTHLEKYVSPVQERHILHLLVRCVVQIVQLILDILRMVAFVCYLVSDSCTFRS
jgi:hypothetical protein